MTCAIETWCNRNTQHQTLVADACSPQCIEFGDNLMQWAERRLEGGATEQWGDKWEEDFALGKGSKKVCSSRIRGP